VSNLVELRRGPIYRVTDIGTGELHYDEGFTGRVYWDSDYNANLVVHFEAQAREDGSLNAVFSDSVSSLPGTVRPSAKIDDASFDVVRVSVPAGYSVDLYVAANGAYRRAVIAPENDHARVVLNIDSYVEALPGKRVIGTYHYGSRNPETLVKIEGNAAIADAELLPPKPKTYWTFSSDGTVPLTVTTHGDAGRSAQVQAAINGHEGTFLVDSGSSGTLLFGNFAEKLGLETVAPGGGSGVNGGHITASWVKVKELKLGGNVLHDVLVQKTKQVDNEGLDGILGFDVLAHALIDVDLPAGKMTILDPTKFAPTVGKGAVAFPVDLATRQPVVHVTIGNGVDAEPMFDTGDSFLVLLSDELRSSGKIVALQSTIQLDGMQFDTKQVFVGVDGTGAYEVPCARINLISVGPYRYENSRVCFGSPRVFGANGGLIGFDFLRHFNWTFDYPDGKVILTPNGAN
jgi:hypothetical protein